MIKSILSAVILLMEITGCSSISVTSDYDPEADFKKYTTFDIYTGVIKGSQLENVPLEKRRVLKAIVSEMEKKGFARDESGNAGLMIYAQAGITEKMNVSDNGYDYGGWWEPDPYGSNIDVSYYTQGSLIIDFVDHSKKELIWRGIGTEVLRDGGTPEERQKFIGEAIAKILSQYPPEK
jgi:hypothetical protein